VAFVGNNVASDFYVAINTRKQGISWTASYIKESNFLKKEKIHLLFAKSQVDGLC